MALVVMKFGGSSVGDAQRLMNVANRIVEKKREGHNCVVVVSAMGKTTDKLIAQAKEINPEPAPREMDILMSSGETISSALLAIGIQSLGEQAVAMVGNQLGIHTDSAFTKARITDIDTAALFAAIEDGNIVICAGFQGIDPAGNITTLGRGGSDTTAVALAVALKADVCEVYTDVDGVYTADPRVVPDARKHRHVFYEEMLEMASLGAKVMMNRSIELCKKYNLRLHVRSSLNRNPGTLIVREDEEPMMEKPIVRGVTVDKNQALIAIRGVLDRPGIAAKVFGALADANINVDMIVQSSAEHTQGTNDISFTVSTEDLKQSKHVLEKVAKEMHAKAVNSTESIAKVSIVGVGMRSHAGVAAKMFDALHQGGVNILMISTSEIKVSCIIDIARVDEAVRQIHSAFELGKEVPELGAVHA